MKVFSNTSCLFILCAAPSSKLFAGITRDGAIISMDPIMALEPPISGKGQKVSSCIIANVTAIGTRTPTHGLASF